MSIVIRGKTNSVVYGPNLSNTGLITLLDSANSKSYIGSGTTINDIGGSGNTGALVNSVYFDSSSTYLQFNGSTQYATLLSNNLIYGSASRTISVWAYPSTASVMTAVSYGTGSAISLGISGSNYQFNDILVSGVSTNNWYNLVGTYNGTIASLYSNGVLLATASRTWVTTSANAYWGLNTNLTGYWNGLMSHLAIYNRALSSTEVAQNYNALKSRFGKSFVAAPPPTYATWDPSKKYTIVALSNSNLTAQTSGGGVLATVGKTSGKWYWELYLTSVTIYQGHTFAVARDTTGALTNSNYLGYDSNSWSWIYWLSGSVNASYYNSAVVVASYGPTYVTGDVISIALDMNSGSLYMYKNGTLIGTAISSGITGTIYPAWGTFAGQPGTVTLNCGQNTWDTRTSSIRSNLTTAGYTIGLY